MLFFQKEAAAHQCTEFFTLTEKLFDENDEGVFFTCRIDSAWVGSNQYNYCLATVLEVLKGAEIRRDIKLIAQSERFKTGTEYLVYGGTDDGYLFGGFGYCNGLSGKLHTEGYDRKGDGSLKMIRKFLKLKEEKFTGQVEFSESLFRNSFRVFAKGAFVNGKPDGFWQHYDFRKKSDPVVELSYSNGKKHGIFKKYYPFDANKQILMYLRSYENGRLVLEERHGSKGRGSKKELYYMDSILVKRKFTYYHENDSVKSISTYLLTHFKWKRHFGIPYYLAGKSEEYYKNGNLMTSGLYSLGAKIGTWFHYNEDGSLKEEIRHQTVDTSFSGFRVYHPNGQIKIEGKLNGEKRTGIWKSYYADEQLYVTGGFENGKEHGIFERYRSDGTKWVSRYYENGIQEGQGISYHDDGKTISSIANFKNGKKDGLSQSFSKEGILISTDNYIDGLQQGKSVNRFKGEKDSSTSIINYKDGYFHGLWINYRNGKLVERKMYNMGIIEGVTFNDYGENGYSECFFGPLKEGEYIRQQAPLKCTNYNKDGTIKKVDIY